MLSRAKELSGQGSVKRFGINCECKSPTSKKKKRPYSGHKVVERFQHHIHNENFITEKKKMSVETKFRSLNKRAAECQRQIAKLDLVDSIRNREDIASVIRSDLQQLETDIKVHDFLRLELLIN